MRYITYVVYFRNTSCSLIYCQLFLLWKTLQRSIKTNCAVMWIDWSIDLPTDSVRQCASLRVEVSCAAINPRRTVDVFTITPTRQNTSEIELDQEKIFLENEEGRNPASWMPASPIISDGTGSTTSTHTNKRECVSELAFIRRQDSHIPSRT